MSTSIEVADRAITENPIIKSLNRRYAVKKYAPEKLSSEKVETLLEAMRLAPSSYGVEPWNFILVENEEIRKKLRPASWNQSQITDASHLLILARPATLGQSHVDALISRTAKTRGLEEEDLKNLRTMVESYMLHKKNDSERDEWANRQIYLSLGTLLVTAAQEGVDATPIEGFEPEKVDEILDLESRGLKSVVLVALGVAASDDVYANLKKVRRPSEDVIIRIK